MDTLVILGLSTIISGVIALIITLLLFSLPYRRDYNSVIDTFIINVLNILSLPTFITEKYYTKL